MEYSSFQTFVIAKKCINANIGSLFKYKQEILDNIINPTNMSKKEDIYDANSNKVQYFHIEIIIIFYLKLLF